MNPNQMTDEVLWRDFASRAVQHYETARFAAHRAYVPLTGSLFHLAIELQLKCGLVKAGAVPNFAQLSRWTRFRRMLQRWLAKWNLVKRPPASSVDEYLQRKYSHGLHKLWRDFKRCHTSEDLTGFDSIIRGVDPWEDVRYPRRDVAMYVQARGVPSSGRISGLPSYRLHVEHIEQLVMRLWLVMGIAPDDFEIVRGDRIEIGLNTFRDNRIH